MDVGSEIALAFTNIMTDEEEEIQRQRRREALEIVRTIRSGTTDDELTTKQRRALGQYEDANARLAILRERSE